MKSSKERRGIKYQLVDERRRLRFLIFYERPKSAKEEIVLNVD
jgi:hypothetical protein